MRTLCAVLIGIVLLPAAISNPERRPVPRILADTVTLSEVRRGSEVDGITRLGDSPEMLVVERPVGATEGAWSSVFVLVEHGAVLQRVPVRYGRASSTLIQVSGVLPGDRIAVSDLGAWDAFERIRLGMR